MKTGRWQRLERLFHEASDLPPADREAFLDATCADDARLRSRLLRMLELDQRHDIIDTPALARHRLGGVRETERLDPPTGTMIGPYRLMERIASGGMGVIYRAVRTDELLDFEVAVKLVRRGVESESIVKRFKDERLTMAHLAHANIAHLLDGGTTGDGRPYLVMEYIHGCPIDRYCDERQLSIERRIELFCVVCRAVHFAHQNLVVHCDLKPGNILVTDDGTPRIVDFGVARMLDRHRRANGADNPVTTDPVGTPDYASPELLAGGPVTTAVDVYALGAVLFGLLTGRRPGSMTRVEGDGPVSARVAADRGTTPRRLQRRLRGDLDAIVLAALRTDPARRYPSAEQLARDLERYVSGRPVTVHDDTTLYRLTKFVRRNRTGVVAATLVTLALTVSIGTTAMMAIAAGWQRDAARRAELHAREHAEHARLESESVQAFIDRLTVSFLRPEQAGDLADPGFVRDLVEREAEHVRGQVDAKPRLRANHLDWLGRILAGYGMHDESRTLALEAMEIRRRAFGSRSLEVALSLRSLGRLAAARGDQETAANLQRHAAMIERDQRAGSSGSLASERADMSTPRSP